MGFELYREVIRHAPDDLDTGELALLLVLADNANEKKRTCAPGQEEICRWMRMEWSGVKAVLRRLAKHKIEVRIVVGKDKLGRDVYAHHGARTTYIIPHFGPVPGDCRCPEHSDAAFEGVATATPSAGEGGSTATPADSNGVATATPSGSEGVATASRRGSCGYPHLPQFPQEENLPLLTSQRLLREAGIHLTEEEETSLIAFADAIGDSGAKGPGWWQRLADRGHLADLEKNWRAAAQAADAKATIRASPASRLCSDCDARFTPTDPSIDQCPDCRGEETP